MSNLRKKFSKIYDQYINKIYRFVYLKVSSREIAEDLTSETFLRGWEAYQNQKTKIENIQAFLYQIARNLVIDFYREKGAANQVCIENCKEMADPQVNLEEKAAIFSDIDTVKTALAALKEDHQNVVIWHYLEDLSIPKIAKMMDRPEGTVRVILHRALKELRDKLSET